jgi:DNA modification methylase
MIDEVQIGDCRMILGDCREVLPMLPKHDLLLTDPPYGIGADKGKKNAPRPFNGSAPIICRHYPENEWDNVRPDKDVILMTVRSSRTAIVWGGNYFADWLTAQGRWLWWDKVQTMPSFGDGELAWTNLPQKTPKKFTLANNKIFADRIERHHPTQKPLELMVWCIGLAGNPQTVLDPFSGSGTTGVACVQLGKQFTGIERERKYFDIACERIENAQRQVPMFPSEVVRKVEQGVLI